MAIDEADQTDAGRFSDTVVSGAESDGRTHEPIRGSDVRVGDYTWADFMAEHGYDDDVSELYPHADDDPDGSETGSDDPTADPSSPDWDGVEFDPTAYLGVHPDELSELLSSVVRDATDLRNRVREVAGPEAVPVRKGVYTWEDYEREYVDDGALEELDREAALGFDPDAIEDYLEHGDTAATKLEAIVEERTVDVREELGEDDFFSTVDGHTTVTNRYDLEKAVPMKKKRHFREEERYWVNKPYSFVIIFHSEKENEKKYYLIEPTLTEIESELQEFLSGKLRTTIKYSDEGVKESTDQESKRTVIENETRRLLKRYSLFEQPSGRDSGLFSSNDDGGLFSRGGSDAAGSDDEGGLLSRNNSSTDGGLLSRSDEGGLLESLKTLLDDDDDTGDDDGDEPDDTSETDRELDGIEARPEPAVLEEDADTLTEYQVEKLLYYLKRNFIGYERIDGIKHDINVEDISCDGYNSPVFVYHSEYEQIITNVFHGKEELDDFVVKLAQRSGKGISKRLPQVDATLPDGSRAQLTLGPEVSDHGTNYTIRQFKDVPFTPVDLINWNTFSLEEMAFLWLCIENHKSLIFAGGTASGKTTSLNAVSLFIPSNTKIVSIEDTREVELPQRNWIASVTRPSFSDDDQGDVDEFDLLEAALRQRPDYIVMGEIRGEEGRTAFQVMSTGHTTYTTFHADSVDEVLKRFTTDPINVSKTMFTALDLVSIQTQTRVQGNKVRRNKSLTEINHYEAENDEINVQDVYQWQAETDEFLKMGDSNTLDTIQFDRGWSRERLENEIFKRKAILAYLIKNGLNTYAEVAATVQAFINDPETILTLIANDQLEESLADLREMESVLIDVDQEKEALVPRPDPTDETYNLSVDILERAETELLEEYRGKVPSGLSSALGDVDEAGTIEVDRADPDDVSFGGDVDDAADDLEWDRDDDAASFSSEGDDSEAMPSWLDESDSGSDDGVMASTSTDVEPESEPPALEGRRDERTATTQPSDETGEASNPAAEFEPATAEADASTGSDDGPEPTDARVADDPDDGTTLDFEAEAASSESGRDGTTDADDEFDGLFQDMGRALEEIERADAEATGEQRESDPSSAEAELETIFDDESVDSMEVETSDSIFATEGTDDARRSEVDGDPSETDPTDTPSDDETTDDRSGADGDDPEPVFETASGIFGDEEEGSDDTDDGAESTGAGSDDRGE
ncbi:ATPase, T2SS/T4P/T4SS family [Natrialbaceae archaeon AArc-T1-2]|uniref:ATPase, T2SS/T4P/T4SS family n=1 Tax=Natrialbaceae archaeon AArc-T1-2 TaxID=3053904 RepID=UPI00255B3B4D|nr:ATPase, T2SS/T4P/T4SS family [Natrialbaceae archaeon AArc-T1-2]WIV67776.1 ATPase, T2SS/T4P/T4SS family [Natrialbaceae archaeon AArc-T1-2]